jgi:GTPase SAR1 family protein
VNVIFVAGTAGSGKSLLTSALRDWYARKSANVITVNLDPGVLNLPYQPDVDIRDLIDFEEVMQTYKLGPNGALILAADLIATRLAEIQDQIESMGPDHVIVDTAGQTELFAFRESGSYFVRELSASSKILLFLIDPLLANTPKNFLSLTLLSASVALRLNVPRISVLTKKDIAHERTENIQRWSKNAATFEEDLATSKDGDEYSLYSELFKTLRKTSFGLDPYPVSSVSQEGFVALVGEISRLAQGGEELTD